MSFLFPTLLTIGLPLAAVPILLHLLNLQRRRKVAWAAMDFLLESEARNKSWVNLKQWLLLAARVLAFILLALMVARPKLTGGMASWLPTERVHHLVLLDDSYSMSEQTGQTDMASVARSAVNRLAERASQNSRHRLTLLPFSQLAATAPSELTSAGTTASQADDFTALRRTLESWQPTQTAAMLEPALRSAAVFAAAVDPDERVMVYVVSDFRRRNVEATDACEVAFDALRQECDSLELIACASPSDNTSSGSKSGGANLGIAELSLLPSAQSADMELIAKVAVTNHGSKPVPAATVKLRRDGVPLPALSIEQIAPGKTVEQQFAVRFTGSGEHHLQAELDADAVSADNQRYLVTALPADRPVLLVDGSSEGQEGFAFAAALRPRGDVRTGWSPQRIEPAALASLGDLSSFAAVLLLDVAELDAAAVQSLRLYASQRGGILVTLGEQADRQFYNSQLFADAELPLLPIKLDLPTQTEATSAGTLAAMSVTPHPIFKVFEGDRNSFLPLMRVSFHHSLEPPASDANSSFNVIAKLGGETPLVIERTILPGRVIAMLTTVARPPQAVEGWSNLSISPVFPVLANEIVAYLAAPRLAEPPVLVGQSLSTLGSLSKKETSQRIELSKLEADGTFSALASGLASGLFSGQQAAGESTSNIERATEQGIYRIQQGASVTQFAVNVDPREGDLATLADRALRDRFAEVDLAVLPAERLAQRGDDTDRTPLYQWLGLVLLGLLAAEQGLAYLCSYHSPAPRGASA